MPWIVGIDEAGYGPNLGPFVMSAVSCRLPEGCPESDLWRLLRRVVRRKHERADGRLWIEDSKVVYGPARGLKQLERGVLATLAPPAAAAAARNSAATESLAPVVEAPASSPLTVERWVEHVSPGAHAYLRDECWYAGTTPLPIAADHGEVQRAAGRFRRACGGQQLAFAGRSVVVCPARFNGLLDRWGSKSIVLMLSLAELVRHCCRPDGSAEAVHILVDKHGGRNRYADILREAIPQATVEPVQEGQELSVYRIAGLGRDVRICFRPRAEASHFCVALASMLAKYVRELLMHEFNRFWLGHLPDLEPTAGYPADARRFWEAIRPVAEKLGIPQDRLWRRR